MLELRELVGALADLRHEINGTDPTPSRLCDLIGILADHVNTLAIHVERRTEWPDETVELVERPSAADYESGRRARRAGCYRALACPETVDQLREWLRGWDDENAALTSQVGAGR